MKGLLLKDLYLAGKHCRSYVLLVIVFLAVAMVGEDNVFFLFYPCILAGMLPVTLLSYDERSGWDKYCGTLPYTRAQIVSAKYIFGLAVQVIVLAVSSLCLAASGRFSGEILVVLVALGCVGGAISLPVMFRYGVEKGRIAYYIMVGVVCGGSGFATAIFEELGAETAFGTAAELSILLVSIGLLALSWYLSVRFYEKREI